MPVIPAMWEVKVGGSRSEAIPGQKLKALSERKKRGGKKGWRCGSSGRAQGSEFKPQFHQKVNKIFKIYWFLLSSLTI
jgi:hypothetical protein